jgi:hypothetical protein
VQLIKLSKKGSEYVNTLIANNELDYIFDRIDYIDKDLAIIARHLMFIRHRIVVQLFSVMKILILT